MSFLKRLFTGSAPDHPAAHSRLAPSSLPPSSRPGVSGSAKENASRRELLRNVLRDTLQRTGIPTAWIGADLLAATSRGREPGIHVRLLLKHWDPRLMLHGVAFEVAFRKRMLTLDADAERWLLGISWQFTLADESSCPQMPHPGVWTSDVAQPPDAAGEPATARAQAEDLLGGSIVISGPAASPDSSTARPAAGAANPRGQAAGRRPQPMASADAKADLERLLAIRDADIKRHTAAAAAPVHFEPTEPAQLASVSHRPGNADTEAGGLDKAFAKTEIQRRPAKAGAGP